MTAAHPYHAFKAADDAWSDALAAHYGQPGSRAYSDARYYTRQADYPPAVAEAYAVRASASDAYHAHMAERFG